MPTNAIGTGTRNISINCPTDEHAEIGRLAFRLGFKSVGDFMRALVLKGLEQQDAEAARRVRDIRRQYYGATMLAVFLAALVFGHDDMARRARRTRSRTIEDFVEEVVEA